MDSLNPGILQRLDEFLWLPSADVKRLRALLCLAILAGNSFVLAQKLGS